MIQCKDLINEASDYIDGDLPLIKRIGLFFHLVLCTCCRNYVQQIRSTIIKISLVRPKEHDETNIKALASQLQKVHKETSSHTHH